VVAAPLRLITLGGPSMWFDEAVTLWLVRLDLGAMLAQIPVSESTPPLFYLVAWGWGRVFGTGLLGIRALSALAGIATVPVTYAVGARLASRRVGLAAAALVAVSPVLVWHGQDARAYSLLVLLSALSLLAFARAREDPTPRRLAAWALAAVLALCTHYFAAFLVAGEAAWLVVRTVPRRNAHAASGVVLLCAVALLPLAVRQRAHGGASWLSERPLGARFGDLWPHFLAGYGAAPGPLASYEVGAPPALTIAAAALAAAALALALATVVEPREPAALVLALALGLASVALPLVLALAGFDYVFTRNLLPAWLPLALVVALGVGSPRAGRAGARVGVGLCLVLAAITVSAAASPRFGPQSWQRVARALGGPLGARVVLAPASIAMPLALERPGLATLPAAGARVKEIVVLRRGSTSRRTPFHGFRLVRKHLADGAFTLFRFRSARARLVTPEALLGDDPVRRRRSAILLAPPVPAPRRSSPTLRFCRPAPGDTRIRPSIRTPCSISYPD